MVVTLVDTVRSENPGLKTRHATSTRRKYRTHGSAYSSHANHGEMRGAGRSAARIDGMLTCAGEIGLIMMQ
jgi:hypothetical protein